MPPDARSGITLGGLEKRFGDLVAVKSLDLEIAEGEFFSLLGPSGCGKTTTLRMVAGFEHPDRGRILLGDLDVTNLPPNRRPVNMVFQHYALFPHLSVFDNVAFGLSVAHAPRAELRRRVEEILDVVQLKQLAKRKPRQLSGGQQQRVALARALVNRPKALLLDEPLGALDVKLRRQMQAELKRLQNHFGTTFLYVTHDQDEALAMSDRIAIMHDGLVEQVGTPKDIYDRPASEFAANFVGVMNVFDARVDEVGKSGVHMRLKGGQVFKISTNRRPATAGDRLRLMIRPEDIRVHAPGRTPEAGAVHGVISRRFYSGAFSQLHIEVQGMGNVIAVVPHDSPFAAADAGTEVALDWADDDLRSLHAR